MAISQFILNKDEEYRLHVRTRGLALVRIRYYYVGLLGVVAVASGIIANLSYAQLAIYASVAIVGIISNSVIGIMLKSAGRRPQFYTISTYAAIILDVALATAVIFIQDGYPSRATVLYAVPIISSGVLLLRPSAYVVASISGVLYASVLFIKYFLGAGPDSWQAIIAPAAFYPVAFQILAAIVTRFSAANAINDREVSYNQLLGMVRQQVKQPVAMIANLVGQLEGDEGYVNMPQKQQDLIKRIKEENYQLDTTITQLIESTQNKTNTQQESAKEPVNLSEIVRGVANSTALSAARIGNLTANIEDNISVIADGQQLHTAVANIVDNAFRYSEMGTPVDISLESHKDNAILVITDQGRGMSPEQLKSVQARADQFENNAQSNPGKVQLYTMGLGLHVSKLIIERFGGSLDIFSRPRVGTKVTIHLPKK